MAGKNDIFWSEIVSGFGEPCGTPLPGLPPPRPGDKTVTYTRTI